METWEHKGRPARAHTSRPLMPRCGLNWVITIISGSPVCGMTERTIPTPKAAHSSALCFCSLTGPQTWERAWAQEAEHGRGLPEIPAVWGPRNLRVSQIADPEQIQTLGTLGNSQSLHFDSWFDQYHAAKERA